MKLKKLQIQNFRAFLDQTIEFDDYVCFVGPNGAGKSTVLTALNVFFRHNPEPGTDLTNLTDEDFHKKHTDDPVIITLTFTDLSLDEQNEFKHYYRQNTLILMAKAKWEAATKSAPVLQYGIRKVMPEFALYFEAIEADKKAPELRNIYESLQKRYPDLPNASTLPARHDALRVYEEAHPDLCKPLDSTDEFYGVSKGKNRLQRFIQWVYIPPVKFASDEGTEAKKTAIGQLLEKVVRSKVSFKDDINALREKALGEYNALVTSKQDILDEVSRNLCTRLQSWATPTAKLGMKWSMDDSNVSVSDPMAQVFAGDESFLGSLSRMGHGLQRAYLIALLEELASLPGSIGKTGPRLLLACEEPELHQHPPQQRHFMSLFESLSDPQTGNQVMVTTHSPYFVSGIAFENVRMIRNNPKTGEASVTFAKFESIANKIAAIKNSPKPMTPTMQEVRLQQALQPALNEMFFSPVIIFVEGLEDVAYLTSCLILTNKWTAFRRYGCHFIPVGGKSELLQPIIILQEFGLPCYVVLDADTAVATKASANPGTAPTCPDCKVAADEHLNNLKSRANRHKNDNECTLRAMGYDKESPFPVATLSKSNLTMWHNDIRSALVADIGATELTAIENKVRNEKNLVGDGDIKKHELLIGYVMKSLYADGKRSSTLEHLCDTIIAFAQKCSQ